MSVCGFWLRHTIIITCSRGTSICHIFQQRLDIEKKTAEALKKLDGVHKGTYYPLTGMSKDVETKLIADHFLFKNDDR